MKKQIFEMIPMLDARERLYGLSWGWGRTDRHLIQLVSISTLGNCRPDNAVYWKR